MIFTAITNELQISLAKQDKLTFKNTASEKKDISTSDYKKINKNEMLKILQCLNHTKNRDNIHYQARKG